MAAQKPHSSGSSHQFMLWVRGFWALPVSAIGVLFLPNDVISANPWVQPYVEWTANNFALVKQLPKRVVGFEEPARFLLASFVLGYLALVLINFRTPTWQILRKDGFKPQTLKGLGQLGVVICLGSFVIFMPFLVGLSFEMPGPGEYSFHERVARMVLRTRLGMASFHGLLFCGSALMVRALVAATQVWLLGMPRELQEKGG